MINQEIKVHSYVLDKAGAAVKLWYLLRAIDKNGSGKAVVKIEEVKEYLGISKYSFYRYIKNKNLFKAVIKEKDKFVIYYHSLFKVTLGLGLDSWGPCAEVLVSDLKEYKIIGTEIQAQALQCSSRRAAALELRGKKDNTKKLIDPSKLFESFEDKDQKTSSEISPGEMQIENGRVYVEEYFVPFGGSQKGIAKKLGRHFKTISRRLKSTQKVRLHQSKPEYKMLKAYYSYLDKEEWTNLSGRYFTIKGKVYKALTYIYNPLYQLSSNRRRRSEYNKVRG